MQITKRDFIRKLGLLGAAGVAESVLGDEYVATAKTLPPGAVGDPDNVWFGQHMFPLPHTVEDGPSSYLKGGKVVMPAREVPIFHETEVVVVGGGPAGFAAAVASARAGAKTALVEQSGSLGGLFTNGMVLLMLATSRNEGDGRWTRVTRGVCGEFMDRAVALGSYVAKPDGNPGRCHYQPTVDPEGAKYLMDRMVEEAGVEMFFHATGIDVIQDGDRVLGVVFQSKQGPQAILAKQVVDCSGDGDMIFAAGCEYRQITHSLGFVARLANMDRITAKSKPADCGVGPDGLPLPYPMGGNDFNRSTLWTGRLGPQGNGLLVRDMSKAEVYHRKFWWEHVAKLRNTPGWENVFIANTCSQIGTRATRIMKAEYVCDRESIRNHQNEREIVGWFGHDGSHAAMPLSFRSLVPTKGENIIGAGRFLGAPDTVDTFRLICPCFVAGQAAGIAAAMSARLGVSPRNLGYSILRKELENQKVYI